MNGLAIWGARLLVNLKMSEPILSTRNTSFLGGQEY